MIPGGIAAHEGLVRREAKRYRHAVGRGGVELEDLLQAGRMGLLRAGESWDPERGAWSTYATFWVRATMRRWIADNGHAVRVPVYQQERRHKRGVPTHGSVVRLSYPARQHREGDDPAPLLDTLSYPRDADPFAPMVPSSAVQALHAAIAELPDRERRVLCQRTWGGYTLAQIGSEMGLSRERVRQLESDAIDRLRCALGAA